MEVSFGDKPAATIVQLTLRKTNDQSDPKAVIYTSTLMDDIIGSVETRRCWNVDIING